MESIPRDRVTLDTRARFVSCILKTYLCLVLLEMLKYLKTSMFHFTKLMTIGVLTGRKRVEAALKREEGLSMGTSRGGTGGPAMSSLLTQGPCSYRSRSEICMISSYILYKYCISLYYIYTFLVVDLDNICSRQILYKKKSSAIMIQILSRRRNLAIFNTNLAGKKHKINLVQ